MNAASSVSHHRLRQHTLTVPLMHIDEYITQPWSMQTGPSHPELHKIITRMACGFINYQSNTCCEIKTNSVTFTRVYLLRHVGTNMSLMSWKQSI